MDWYRKLRTFLTEVNGELKRTSWPSRMEVQGTTGVVILTVFIFALYLYVVDTFLFKTIDWIFTIAG